MLKKQPLRKHEDVCVFYKKQPTYHPQMTQGEPYDKGIRKNQLSGSYGNFNPGDVILDNTFGSGSFLVAALMEGRNFIGIEKNEDVALFKKESINYIEVAKQRLYAAWMNLDEPTREHLANINLIKDFSEAPKSEHQGLVIE